MIPFIKIVLGNTGPELISYVCCGSFKSWVPKVFDTYVLVFVDSEDTQVLNYDPPSTDTYTLHSYIQPYFLDRFIRHRKREGRGTLRSQRIVYFMFGIPSISFLQKIRKISEDPRDSE